MNARGHRRVIKTNGRAKKKANSVVLLVIELVQQVLLAGRRGGQSDQAKS